MLSKWNLEKIIKRWKKMSMVQKCWVPRIVANGSPGHDLVHSRGTLPSLGTMVLLYIYICMGIHQNNVELHVYIYICMYGVHANWQTLTIVRKWGSEAFPNSWIHQLTTKAGLWNSWGLWLTSWNGWWLLQYCCYCIFVAHDSNTHMWGCWWWSWCWIRMLDDGAKANIYVYMYMYVYIYILYIYYISFLVIVIVLVTLSSCCTLSILIN